MLDNCGRFWAHKSRSLGKKGWKDLESLEELEDGSQQVFIFDNAHNAQHLYMYVCMYDSCLCDSPSIHYYLRSSSLFQTASGERVVSTWLPGKRGCDSSWGLGKGLHSQFDSQHTLFFVGTTASSLGCVGKDQALQRRRR